MKPEFDISEELVADLVTRYPQTVGVFLQHNIDFCCGGSVPLREACTRAGLDEQEIENALKHEIAHTRPAQPDVTTWSKSLLCSYIIEIHHAYVEKAIPVIRELLDTICQVHGVRHPELFDIARHFQALADELLQHMLKEEQILFPAIRETGQVPPVPVLVMRDEHEHAGSLIKAIRELTSHYTPPTAACTTYRLTFERLREFDRDLMQHIHLENNVLFV